MNFSLFSDFLLVTHNYLFRNKMKEFFDDLKRFEEESFHSTVKRPKIKKYAFILVGFLLYIMIYDNIAIYYCISNSIILSYLGFALNIYLNIVYSFTVCRIVHIIRNMFCKTNQLFVTAGDTNFNARYVIFLSKLHFRLTCFVREKSKLFSLRTVVYTAELFLFMVSLVYYIMMTFSVSFGPNSYCQLLKISNFLWTGVLFLYLLFLCRSWNLVRTEVSDKIYYCTQ